MKTFITLLLALVLLGTASAEISRFRRTSVTCPAVPTGVVLPIGEKCKRCKLNCPVTTPTPRPTTTTTSAPTCPPVPTTCPCGVVIPIGEKCKRCKLNCATTTAVPTTQAPTTTAAPTTTVAPTCPTAPTNCPCGVVLPVGEKCKRCKINCPTTPCPTCLCGTAAPSRLRRTESCPVCLPCTSTSYMPTMSMWYF